MTKKIDIEEYVFIPKSSRYDLNSWEILENLSSVSNEDIESIWGEIEVKSKSKQGQDIVTEKGSEESNRLPNDIIESISWDYQKIWVYTKKNCVKFEETEFLWHKWRRVSINLPAVWKFEWFKFDYFESYHEIKKEEFEKNPDFEKKSYSMNEVAQLLKAINEYMTELKDHIGCDFPGLDYEHLLKSWESDVYQYGPALTLKNIVDLVSNFWLKDKDIEWMKASRIRMNIRPFIYFVPRIDDNCEAALFLKMDN